MTRPGFQAAFVCFACFGSAAAAPAQAPAPVAYAVTFPDLDKHHAAVTVTVPTDGKDAVELMLPVWTPGFYRVENYAAKVKDLTAKAPDDTVLAVEQPKKNRWRVKTGGAASIVVAYTLECTGRSVTTNWDGPDYAVLNGAAAFLTPVGMGTRPHEVALTLPAAWTQSATGLPAVPDKPHRYIAPDFDTLVDSPIAAGKLVEATFDVEGSKHSVVGFGDTAGWDAAKTAGELEKIVRATRQMWGELPFKKYVFLCAFRPGGGGLEHLNSTLVTTSAAGLKSPRGNLSWLGLASHEYFHAFNVKRLRPVELGPFDYEKEPTTASLWVAEGLTSYYF